MARKVKPMHLGEHMVHNPRHFEEKTWRMQSAHQKKVKWSKALFLLKCRTHVVEGSFNDNIIEAHTRHLKYPRKAQTQIYLKHIHYNQKERIWIILDINIK